MIWMAAAAVALAVFLIGLAVVVTVRRTLDEALAKLIVTSQSVDVALASMTERIDMQGQRIDGLSSRVRTLEQVRPSRVLTEGSGV